MAELTDEAKAAIAEAVRIVKEDKTDAWWRKRVEASNPPKTDPPVDPPKPTDPPVDPPKPTDPPIDPPVDPPKEPKKSAWWGELYDD